MLEESIPQEQTLVCSHCEIKSNRNPRAPDLTEFSSDSRMWERTIDYYCLKSLCSTVKVTLATSIFYFKCLFFLKKMLCVRVFSCWYVYVPRAFLVLTESRKQPRILGTGVGTGCRLPCEWWELICPLTEPTMLLTASYISRPKLAICGTPSAIIMVRVYEDLCAGGSFVTFQS